MFRPLVMRRRGWMSGRRGALLHLMLLLHLPVLQGLRLLLMPLLHLLSRRLIGLTLFRLLVFLVLLLLKLLPFLLLLLIHLFLLLLVLLLFLGGRRVRAVGPLKGWKVVRMNGGTHVTPSAW